MSNVLVLGAGMVGSAMALDMAKKHSVSVADISPESLGKFQNQEQINAFQLDVTDEEKLRTAIEPYDLIICAVPGFLGFQTLKRIISSGKHVVDISFFPEDALELDALAKQHNSIAVVDCGVAPGMGNIILGRYNEQLAIEIFTCMVGGLPKEQVWPFKYKAPFSPIDVIEEYTRPARYVEHGHVVVREPLTDVELIDFKGVGTLESFNSDGLRTLIKTMKHIPNMKEKTLRYPGHAEYISVLKSTGFFSGQSRMINDTTIRPIDLTNTLLFDAWKLGENEPEFTVMRINITGKDQNGRHRSVQYDLYDEFDEVSKTSSMARTTGYTATAAAELILRGKFTQRGICPPEYIGMDRGCFEHMLTYLRDRNVVYSKTETVE